MKKNMNYRDRTFLITIVALLVIAILLATGSAVVKNRLSENTQEFGMMLVNNYAAEEELNIRNLKKNLKLGALTLTDMKKNGAGQKETEEWVHTYKDKVSYLMDGRIVNFYGVIDGRAVSAAESRKAEPGNFKEREWYKEALKKNGEIAFTGVYEDTITGKDVTTVSMKCENGNDVIALDLYVDRNAFTNNVSEYIEDSSFFVYDNEGSLYYYKTSWKIPEKEIMENAGKMIKNVDNGNINEGNSVYVGKDYVRNGIYFSRMSNGGTVIMTVPLSAILQGKKNVIMYTFAALSMFLFIVIAVMFAKNLFQSRNITTANKTIGLLGDMYYAIYHINYDEDTYECIKTTPELEDILGERGEYRLLASVIKELIDPEDYEELNRRINLEETKGRKKEYTYFGGDFKRRFGDEYRWVSVRIIQDGRLAPGESIWCLREVDEEKRKELQNTLMMKEALETARRKTKAKTEFFSRMSHDMRTPLNAIIGFSQLSHTCDGDYEKMQDYMKKIELSGEQLLSLINDILEYSGMEAEKTSLNVEKFNIKETVETVMETFEEKAEETERNLSCAIDIEHHVINGDGFKLVQIMNNLISNSMKYSHRGDSITVKLNEFGTGHIVKYQLIVEDTGIGMSREFLQLLFEPYARENYASTKNEIEGTGLGMLIVKNLVSLMNGEISVDSEKGKGTTVSVTLPFEVQEKTETYIISPEEEKESQEKAEEYFFEGKNILVAEDNELNMEIVTELLKMRKVNVTQAWDGKQALDLFRESTVGYFDCILMDMHMPVMDGCTSARSIRELDRADAGIVPIIAVTANAFAEDIDKTTAAGMNGHVSKPLEFDVLYKILNKMVN